MKASKSTDWARAVIAMVKATREDADLSRRELAERLGWKVEQVINFEQGRKALKVQDFIEMAYAMRIQPDELMKSILDFRRRRRSV